MKVKANPRTGVTFEAEAGQSALPPITVPELTLKRILVPVDFSECSRKALHYGTCFARQFQAEVLLLHVLEPIPAQVSLFENTMIDTSWQEDATKRLLEWQKEAESPTSVRAFVRQGAADHEIVLAAEEFNTDLIIIGTQGRTGLAHLVLGSTAERVVRYAKCPVLVVRDREHDFLSEAEMAKDNV